MKKSNYIQPMLTSLEYDELYPKRCSVKSMDNELFQVVILTDSACISGEEKFDYLRIKNRPLPILRTAV